MKAMVPMPIYHFMLKINEYKELFFMKSKSIKIGNTPFKTGEESVDGEFVTLDNERYYKISNYNQMPPFFMSVVSNSDQWMFIWSNGALSAGRQDPDHALFPYYTADKIRDYAGQTGNKNIIFVKIKDRKYLWEPFSEQYEGVYKIERNCYKNQYGNKLIFEEINHDLEVTFQYAWMNSEKYGFVKKSRIINESGKEVGIEVLDGIRNILPHGLQQRFQNEYSSLGDGYKKNELIPETGLGIFSMSSIPTDKAEPNEALRATTVWSTGIDAQNILISSRQLDNFRQNKNIEQKTDVRAARGAYFVNSTFNLKSKQEKEWYIVAEIDQDTASVASLNEKIKEDSLEENLEKDIEFGTQKLAEAVASADGMQKTADQLSSSRHLSNTLFNIMRGGYFCDSYQIKRDDFIQFVRNANDKVYAMYQDFLNKMPEIIHYNELISQIEEQNSSVLEKLCYEYLPLAFSRRHGDPSRPWNNFTIKIKDEEGNKILNYEGNWRDIFQNWEALAHSFPIYIESMIAKFVNASTVDGYNPYRVTRSGFDWEIIDPDDPWSYIGYWGDHQIVYLYKLMQLSAKYHPGKLESLLNRNIFTYANVPYRIKSYSDILSDPHETIDFNQDMQESIEDRVDEIGNDGKLVLDEKGNIFQVNLAEKLLVPILAKLSNFVPEGGIWMNTQRPEWNDANNALVGYGVSMVTLYYLRKHLAFCHQIFEDADLKTLTISKEAGEWLENILQTFMNYKKLLKDSISDKNRKAILDELEIAAENYREKIYSDGFSGQNKEINISQILNFFDIALKYIDHTIEANQREDNLYEAYNLINLKDSDKISIRKLYEMLEGQVAVLSSGYLSIQESLDVLKALRNSRLYREDQNSYILYPDRKLPRFLEKNNIPQEDFQKSKLLQSMLDQDDKRIVTKDIKGNLHFNGNLHNNKYLQEVLDNIEEPDLKKLASQEKDLVMDIYEKMFDHQSFTGRSGTFYKYEGLGCIYWHMVSKLLLSVGDLFYRAKDEESSSKTLSTIKDKYYEIRRGIGVTKSPDEYGAFPIDPYSHTPSYIGAQQPGLTGQVKEDFISRFKELGVIVEKGQISFYLDLLRDKEFLAQPSEFKYYDTEGNEQTIDLEKGSLAFTIAQVPIIYHLSEENEITITESNNQSNSHKGNRLNENISREIFMRSGRISRIDVYFDVESS